MDMDTTYSYVTIEIVEVVEYTEGETPIKTNTFVDRLKNQIVNTWENVLDSLESLLFSLIAAIPVLIILMIVVVVFKIVKKKRGNKKNWMDEALEVIKDAEEKEDNEK
jgi:short subunit fatty acids transporter